MKKLDKIWVFLDRFLSSLPWWNIVLIFIAFIICAIQISNWVDCSHSGGRFMRSPFGFYECVK